uniref:Uncharacterized protein n=1 Tax=Anguilla anguilla TaxID=7936 RepID=A0A0E9VM41_ANGAN
MRCSCQAF